MRDRESPCSPHVPLPGVQLWFRRTFSTSRELQPEPLFLGGASGLCAAISKQSSGCLRHKPESEVALHDGMELFAGAGFRTATISIRHLYWRGRPKAAANDFRVSIKPASEFHKSRYGG